MCESVKQILIVPAIVFFLLALSSAAFMSCREPEPKIQELKAHTDTAQKLEQTKKTLLRPAIVMDDNGETPEKAIERFQLLRNWPAQEKGFAFVSRGSSFHVRMVFARKVSTHILQSVLIL